MVVRFLKAKPADVSAEVPTDHDAGKTTGAKQGTAEKPETDELGSWTDLGNLQGSNVVQPLNFSEQAGEIDLFSGCIDSGDVDC